MSARRLDEVLAGYTRAAELRDRAMLRELFRRDLYALLVLGCGRLDMRHQWLLDRCDEVQMSPDGHLDLWARDHYKSTIITVGKTIQDILIDPEVTVGIFSHTSPIAKGFLGQIKRELEANVLLKDLYPEILWENPQKEAPRWSLDGGLIVKRKTNPKECTIEAWGVVEGQPIGKHFARLVYDDLVTMDNAASPEMRAKTLASLEMSYNLGTKDGVRRFVGTRYHYSDAYQTLIERGTAAVRVHRAAGDDGVAVLLPQDVLDAKRRDMGPYAFASQMMLDPKQDGSVGFKPEWWRTYNGHAVGNTYIIVDPANKKRKDSDYTAIFVITISEDGNYYIRHLLRDRLSLSERIETLFELHRTWRPLAVGYEEYGLQADIEAMQRHMDQIGYRFTITPLGGKVSKYDRIIGLMPLFEQGKIWLPPSIHVTTRDSGEADQIAQFRNMEYAGWPYSAHDDGLDCLARITDPALKLVWPGKTARPLPARPRVQARRWVA